MSARKTDDKPKIIVLLVAVAAVFGFGAIRFMGNSSPKPAAEDAVEHIGGPVPAPSTGVSASTRSPIRVAALPMSNINPFRDEPAERVEQVQTPPIRVARNNGKVIEMPPTEFTRDLGPALAPIIEETAKLQGLIVGKDPLAIISIGSEVHYISKDSPKIKGLKLESMNGQRAKLRVGREVFDVAVGDTFTLPG